MSEFPNPEMAALPGRFTAVLPEARTRDRGWEHPTQASQVARILLVDDEPRVLAGYSRRLRVRFSLSTAEGPAAALDELERGEPIAVVVSDLRMPGMNGLELLTQFRIRSPETVRLMLTGDADLSAAQAAVNEGRVFRFLTKPCDPEILGIAIDEALAQYSLERAEYELLNNTLNGTVRLLSEMVSLVDGSSQALVPAIRTNMRHLCEDLGFASWEFDVAAMLCQLGNLTLPAELSAQLVQGRQLDARSAELAARGTDTARRLLSEIPRLADVGRMIGQSLDPAALDIHEAIQDPIAAGSVMLHHSIGWSQLHARGIEKALAAAELVGNAQGRGSFARQVASSLAGQVERSLIPRLVSVSDLTANMILQADVTRKDGAKLLAAGCPLTGPLIERIATFAASVGVAEPIHVLTADAA